MRNCRLLLIVSILLPIAYSQSLTNNPLSLTDRQRSAFSSVLKGIADAAESGNSDSSRRLATAVYRLKLSDGASLLKAATDLTVFSKSLKKPLSLQDALLNHQLTSEALDKSATAFLNSLPPAKKAQLLAYFEDPSRHFEE